MTFVGWSQIAIVLALTLIAAIPLGGLIVKIYAGEANLLTPVLRPVERVFYRLAGVDETGEQTWLVYAMAMIAFSIAGFLSLYALQRLQGVLPLNPQQFPGVPSDLAFNTSISFITNTNWQNYAGEQTMSHLTQMLGLTVHNFLSAATGLAMAFALVRAFARSSSTRRSASQRPRPRPHRRAARQRAAIESRARRDVGKRGNARLLPLREKVSREA
jgi:K+-transporting ATPase ATPase A chain